MLALDCWKCGGVELLLPPREPSPPKVLAPISERERFVLAGRCGYEGQRTLAAIGVDLGVTRTRVRQIEDLALRKLRSQAARARSSQYVLDEATYADLVAFRRAVYGEPEEEA